MSDNSVSRISLQKLCSNPWHFRLMYDKDYNFLLSEIKKNGFENVSVPIIAKIEKKFYIVDGHSRIRAANDAKLKSIPCRISSSIKTLVDLRIRSFQLNKEGYSNPLSLSDMFYEDLKSLGNTKEIAIRYNVNEKYVESVLKIRELHDDAKLLINKIINTAKRKYQFILHQITPEHLSHLSQLPSEKQVQVVDWILRDLMYGPADESMVSIPSTYEIIEEISQIQQHKEKKTYNKNHSKLSNSKSKELSLVCKCGTKYDIDTKSSSVYEYIEQDNIILKKKFDGNESYQIFSSKEYSKKDLIKIIEESEDEIRLICPG